MEETRRIPTLIAGFGVATLLLIGGEGAYVLLHPVSRTTQWIGGLVTSLPFTVGIIYAGYRLPDSQIGPDRYVRLACWCLGGLAVFLAMNLVVMYTRRPLPDLTVVAWLRWAATIGWGVGLTIGLFEARGIERAVDAERARVRAAEAEEKEQLLNYLNATLRHEILNTATVIEGNADLAMAESTESAVRRRMETIKDQTEDLAAVIDDVRVLLDAYRSELEPRPTDVTDLLTAEITALEDAHDAVVVRTDLPDRAVALANRSIGRAFANLLWNAVEHNDGETPRVEVAVDLTPETVVVRVADDGPGIPTAERDRLFTTEVRNDANHGLGLPLTKELVDAVGGTVELTETGPDGTVFTVRLSRASEPPREEPRPDETRVALTGGARRERPV